MSNTTSTAATGWRPDHIADLDLDEVMPDLWLVAHSTKAGEVSGDEPSVRVPFVSADPEAATVAEGAAIEESDPTLSEVVISTHKVATLSVVSNELVKQPNASARLIKSVNRAVAQTANKQYMSALATESANFTDGGALGSANLDAMGDLLTEIEANGGEPSAIFMRAEDWKVIQKIKSSTGSNAPLVGVGVGDAQERRLFGVRVIVTNDVPRAAEDAANKIIVVSRPDLVSAYGSLTLATSEHFAFDKDSTAIRSTFRFGVKASRPGSRFGVLDGVTVNDTP